MSNLPDLQARLNAIADGKLKNHLEQVFLGIDALAMYNVKTPFLRSGSSYPVDFRDVCRNLKDVAFDALQESWHAAETAEFLNRVQSLGQQIDELRNEVAEVTQ